MSKRISVKDRLPGEGKTISPDKPFFSNLSSYFLEIKFKKCDYDYFEKFFREHKMKLSLVSDADTYLLWSSPPWVVSSGDIGIAYWDVSYASVASGKIKLGVWKAIKKAYKINPDDVKIEILDF